MMLFLGSTEYSYSDVERRDEDLIMPLIMPIKRICNLQSSTNYLRSDSFFRPNNEKNVKEKRWGFIISRPVIDTIIPKTISQYSFRVATSTYTQDPTIS